MTNNGYFYHGSIAQYVKMLVDLFSRINIQRTRSDGRVEYIKVPVIYATKEKYIRLLTEANQPVQPGENAKRKPVPKVAQILPAITISLVDIDAANTHRTSVHNNIRTSKTKMHNPSPYKFMFEVSIQARYTADIYQIAEQILPYFNPHFALRIKEIHQDDREFDRSILVEISSVTPDEDSFGDVTSIRRLEWAMMVSFVGWIYPPRTDGQSGIIKTIYMDFQSSERVVDETTVDSITIKAKPDDVEFDSWEGEIEETWTPGPVAPKDDKDEG